MSRRHESDRWAWWLAGVFFALSILSMSASARADTLCSVHTDQAWPDTKVYVSGIEVSGTVTVTAQPDGSELRCVDVPGLVRPFAVSVVACNAAGCTPGVRADGSPQPVFAWPSRACRYDANEDGAVGLDDVGDFLGAAWNVEACVR